MRLMRVCRRLSPGPVHSTGATPIGATACIVTCHDYAHYLPACLESILAQSVPFDHVIVVDDASTDETPAVCRTYADRGVRYLRGEWRDVAQARNAGVEALPRTEYILSVDADNALPAGYHGALRSGMGPGVGATYCPLRFVGGEHDGELSQYVTEFDYWGLRRRNFADTCSLVRREAYDAAGGWRSNAWGLHDWSLWLRVTRAGWAMARVDDTELRYRVHAGQMSDRRRGRYECGVAVMREAMGVCLVTLFCGRRWCLDAYGRFLAGLDWPRENLTLLALDNSGDPRYGEALRRTLEASGIRHLVVTCPETAVPGVTAQELADSASLRRKHERELTAHVGRLYGVAQAHVPAGADLVWCVEDDVDPGRDALNALALELFRHRSAGMVVGCLRSKHESERLIAWTGESTRQPVRVPPAAGEVTALRETGFFCSLLRRDTWERITFRAAEEPPYYYDWAACADVRACGESILMAGSVRCLHRQPDGTAVAAEPGGPRSEVPAAPMRLNLGCGRKLLQGYTNVDLVRYPDADYRGADFRQGDAVTFLWGLPDGSACEILAEQFLEHLTHADGLAWLRECRRVLMPDGTLTLEVPDIAAHMRDHLEHRQRVTLRGHGEAPLRGIYRPETNLLIRILYPDPWGHRACYDGEMLQTALTAAGFEGVRVWSDGVNVRAEAKPLVAS